MARLGQHLPRLLAERGIDAAFGLPDRGILDVFRGLPGSGLNFHAARTAAGAGFMAEGFARAGGRPAACLLGHGPGAVGVAPALAQALSESQPLLLLTAGPPLEGAAPCPPSDPVATLKGLCRWSRRIEAAEEAPEALDAACALFAAARSGPVHVEIPADLMTAEVGALDASPSSPPAPAAPLASEVAEALIRLTSARAPLLLLGGGALSLGRARAEALAERIGGPVLTTANARGLLAADHPLHLGGRFPAEAVRGLVAGADALLALGAEFSPREWRPGGGRPPAIAPDALIRVDRDPAQLAAPAAGLGIACDAALFVEALLESLPPRSRAAPDLGALQARAAGGMPARLSRHQPLLDALWEHLPEAVVIADPCEPGYAAMAAARPPAPGRFWTSASGFEAMGYAVPAAIGAKIADHRRPMLALTGDGGALATIGELAAAVEHGAHVVVLVWNNSGLVEAREQMRAAQIRPVGVDLSPVEFQNLARGVGATYARVSGLDYLRDAIRGAVTKPTPCVIEMREEFWFG